MKKFLSSAFFAAIALVSVSTAQAASTFNSATVYTADQANVWTVDRHLPEGWTGGLEVAGKTDVLSAAIGSTLDGLQQGDNFYRTEGKKLSLPNGVSAVETQLYIDPAWNKTAVRAGIWATSNATSPEWGIIEYTTANSYVVGSSATLVSDATFRTWDSNAGSWTPVTISVNPSGEWVTLRTVLAPSGFSYYINGQFVREVPLASFGNATGIKEVILNSYNYGLEGAPVDEETFGNRGYTVSWNGLNTVSSFDTLQSALDAASEGSTVTVTGTTTENVTVSKPLTITGSDATVNGSIVISTSSVSVSGITLNSISGTGLEITNGAQNVTVSGNTFHVSGTSGTNVQALYIHNGAGNVTVSGNTFSDITAVDKSAKAIFVGDSTDDSLDISNITISQNTFSNIVSGTRGAYGILVNHSTAEDGAATRNLVISDNVIKGLKGEWATAIGLEGNTPGASVTGNTTQFLLTNSGASGVAFKTEDNASADSVIASGNSNVQSVAVSTSATSTPAVFAVEVGADPLSIALAPYGSTVSSATVNQPIEATVATADGQISVFIPEGVTITSGSSWDGQLSLPRVISSSSVTTPSVGSGLTSSVGIAISVGAEGSSLTFDKAIKLVFPGQAGKSVGFADGSGTLTEIVALCDIFTSIDGQIPAGGECKASIDSDLVVWTKHFTNFATYSVAANSASASAGSSRSGGRSGGSSSSVASSASASTASTGRVLGASSFKFSANVSQGAQGDAVTELQTRLIAGGFLKVAATGFFGPITLEAVKAYQTANGLPSTGFVGPLTIAKLNASESSAVVSGMPATSNAASSSSASLSAKQFVDLLISLGVISADKAVAAKAAVAGN